PAVLTLMKGVMKTMFLAKLKLATAVLLGIGLIGAVNLAVYGSLAAEPKQITQKDGQDPSPAGNQTRPSDPGNNPSNDRKKNDKEDKGTNQSGPEKPAGEGNKEVKANDLPQGPWPYWVTATVDQDGKFVVSASNVIYETRYTKIKKDG